MPASETRPKSRRTRGIGAVVMNLPANLAESAPRTLTGVNFPPERLRQNAQGSHSRLVRIRCRHMFSHQIVFDPALIARYDRSGPRYTSYPTAVQFRGAGSTSAAGAGDARDGGGRERRQKVPGCARAMPGFGEHSTARKRRAQMPKRQGGRCRFIFICRSATRFATTVPATRLSPAIASARRRT